MSAPPTLRRELGLWEAVGVGLGAIIGAGIFVVIGVAAGIAGPALIAGLAVAAGVAICNALSSAELAARYPTSGGTYEYGYELVHPLAGFSAGWMFLASKLAAGGTVGLGFGFYLSRFIPSLDPRVAGLVAVVALTGANLFGIRKAGRLNLAIVAVTVSTLVAFVAMGLPHIDSANLTPIEPGAILPAAALLFFSYTGYARLATLAEEVHEPKLTIPRAIIISLGIAVVLYGFVAVVALGTLGADGMGRSDAPLEAAALQFSGTGLAQLIVIGATTAMLGVLLSQILGISRMMLAMSRRGDLPKLLGHIGARHQIPSTAIVLTGVVMALLVAFGTLKLVASAASFTILLYYSITNIAALRMAPEDKRFSPWIARIGLASCLVLALSLDVQTFAIGLGVLAVGVLGRFWSRRK
ncbi:MAG: amino acid permease [Methanoregulaceae archaeon]|nr:amino acid permease [Methanoregulaceae archaeon]